MMIVVICMWILVYAGYLWRIAEVEKDGWVGFYATTLYFIAGATILCRIL